MVDNQFLKESNKQMVLVSDDIDELLRQMHTYSPPKIPKWIDQDID